MPVSGKSSVSAYLRMLLLGWQKVAGQRYLNQFYRTIPHELRNHWPPTPSKGAVHSILISNKACNFLSWLKNEVEEWHKRQQKCTKWTSLLSFSKRVYAPSFFLHTSSKCHHICCNDSWYVGLTHKNKGKRYAGYPNKEHRVAIRRLLINEIILPCSAWIVPH